MTTRPNGCHNRAPLQPQTMMQDGWIDQPLGSGVNTRIPNMVPVPFRMSTKCNYSRDPMGYGQKDPRCKGCKWRQPTSHEPVKEPA